MRSALLAAAIAALMPALQGGACIIDTRDRPQGTVLGVSVTKPTSTRTVAQGEVIPVAWSMFNRTHEVAIVTLQVERRADRSRITLAEYEIESETARREFSWDTSGFASGDYAVVARIEAGGFFEEAGSLGRILINEVAGFAFTAPTTDQVLPNDGTVTISWTGGDADGDGKVSLFVDPDANHTSGNEIEILDDRPLPATRGADSFAWDGTNAGGAPVAAGTYSFFAEIDDGVNPSFRVEGPARITTPNAPPTVTITAPTAPQEINSGDKVTISWTVTDPENDVFVTILRDDDQNNDTNDTTPPVAIVTRQQDDDKSGTFEWDTTGVAAGTYFIQAQATDDVNAAVFAVSTNTVTISNSAPELAITAPTANTEFASPLQVKFTAKDPDDDVLVDIKIDADDNHANGNEITILSQRLVPRNTTGEQTFDWDGNNASGGAVPSGIYSFFATATDGTNPTTQVVATPLIFKRTSADQPLIALLEPNVNTDVEPGGTLNIKWRDEDPTGKALIRLTVDDDGTPDEATETDDAEVEILANRDAGGDGVLDTFAWQNSPALDPGTYWVFAYIVDGANEHVSIGQGRIIVPDPGGN